MGAPAVTTTGLPITLAVDAMSGDHGLASTVPGALPALAQHPQLQLILVGNLAALESAVARHAFGPRLQIHPASEVVAMGESPSKSLRNKKDSSLRVAINLVKEGRAQAVVSAGNTGALMATARFVLKTLPGIDRPAICAPMPAMQGKPYMLDLGANADCAPEQLLQFAYMGAALASVMEGHARPRVALLNIGEEEIKGNEIIKATAALLQASPLNYIGFVEGDGIFKDQADVIVADGFTGNIALKSAEGAAKLLRDMMKAEFTRSPLSKLSAFAAMPVLKRLTTRMDPRNYNGASLLGLNGLVIKSHGSADATSFACAISVALREVEHDVIGRIRALLPAAAI